MYKKKVLIVTSGSLRKSGVSYVIYSVIKSLHELCDFDILSFEKGDYYYRKLLDEGIANVTLTQFKNKKPKTRLGTLILLLFLRHRYIYKKTKALTKNKQYYAIHCFCEFDSYGALKAAKKYDVSKRILHVNIDHKTIKSNTIKAKILNYIEKRNKGFSFKYANILVGVSKQCCQNAFGYKKHILLYNCYDESKFNHDKSCLLDNNHLVITQIATFNENKNQLFTVLIAKELRKYTKEFTIQLIGWEAEKGYLDKIKETIDKNELESCVKIIDGSSSISDYLCNTSVGILPSQFEGAPISTVEFQACGIPVFISSNVPIDVNCGGAFYLKLSDGPEVWAKTIWEYFKKNGNRRNNYNMSRFSSATFKHNLMEIYDLK